MRPFLPLLVAIAAVACVGATDPQRDPIHCLYPGDTIGVLPFATTADSVITKCIWILETKNRCYVGVVERVPSSACVVGQKWEG